MIVQIFRKIGYFILVSGIFCSISAQSINIKGKVVGGSGPIEGAAVHLLKADKIAYTNASGEFNITDASPPLKARPLGFPLNTGPLTISGKPFNLPALLKGTEYAISINKAYNIKGALKAVIPHPLSSEMEGLRTGNGLFRSSGLFITETQYSGKTHYGKRASIAGPGIGKQVPPGAFSEQSVQALQKTTAPDELVISALGKNQYRANISELDKDVGQIKLTDGGTDKYHSYTQLNLTHEGKTAYVVVPDNPDPAKPWIWRARFWDDSPELDLRLVAKGYYLVYVDVARLYGNDEGIKRWETFYDMAVKYWGFWPKVVVSGWSRAGFQIFRFSAQNPEKVSVVFADAATCNWRAWPKKPIWGMSKKEAEEWKGNPSDSSVVVPMVKGDIAVIHEIFVGDGENWNNWTYKMQELYQDLGGIYEILVRTKGSHVSHGTFLDELEAFIKKHNPLPQK